MLIPALEEMLARIVSDCIHTPEVMEQAITQIGTHVRAWWIADRGGPFRRS